MGLGNASCLSLLPGQYAQPLASPFYRFCIIQRRKETHIVNTEAQVDITSIPLLTLLQYFAKVLVVACAVPPPVPELVLALPDAQPGSFGYLTDNLRLGLAQLSLLTCQTFRLPAYAVRVHHQRTAHRPEQGLNNVREQNNTCLLSHTAENVPAHCHRPNPSCFSFCGC